MVNPAIIPRRPDSDDSSSTSCTSTLDQDQYFKDCWTQSANWNNLFQLQLEDDNRRTADVHLFCQDGCVPVHTALIAYFSPLMEELLIAQGPNWIGIRTVILPDVKVEHVKFVINLLYTGTTQISCPGDKESVLDVFELLGIQDYKDDLLEIEVEQKSQSKNSIKEPGDVRYYYYGTSEDDQRPGVVYDDWGAQGTNSEDLLSLINRRDEIEDEMNGETGDEEEQEMVVEESEDGGDGNDDAEGSGPGAPGEQDFETGDTDTLPNADDQDDKNAETEEGADTNEESKAIDEEEDEFFEIENTQEANQVTEDRGEDEEEEFVHTQEVLHEEIEDENDISNSVVGNDINVIESDHPLASSKKTSVPVASSTVNEDTDDDDEDDCKILDVVETTRCETRRTRNRFRDPAPDDEDSEFVNINSIKTEGQESSVPDPCPYSLRARKSGLMKDRSDSTDTEGTSSTFQTDQDLDVNKSDTEDEFENADELERLAKSKKRKAEPATGPPERRLRSNLPRINYFELVGGPPSVEPKDLYEQDSDWSTRMEDPSPAKQKKLGNVSNWGSSRGTRRLAPRKSPVDVRGTASDTETGVGTPSTGGTLASGSGIISSSTSREIWDSKNIEARLNTCQICHKVYPNAGDAADCIIAKHHRIRCYFCFGICNNQTELYAHYLAAHNKPLPSDKLKLKPESISCEICGDIVNFYNVSTHLITKHMKKPTDGNGNSTSTPGKPVARVKVLNFD